MSASLTEVATASPDADKGRRPYGRGAWTRVVRVFGHVATFAVVVGLWTLVSQFKIVDPTFLPRPIEVWNAIFDVVQSPGIWDDVFATAQETIGGFVAGAFTGVVLGAAMHYAALVRRLVNPYIIVLQVMPKVVLAPLFVAWLGFGIEPKVVTAATMVFFPVLVNTMLGLASMDPDAIELLRSLPAGRTQVFIRLAVPSALPAVSAGLLTAATLAPIGAVVAEFISAQQGLGLRLTTYLNQMAVPEAYAVILMISAISLILYGAVRLFQRRVVFWGAS
ncbi:ABC transporter permease [Streptosporangium sp. NPDC051022]|uniref:ABC transporter permease n=1 Tax=Streptosporangium sp. NPDC051022 TaxID=3155752 RepID=UPI0034454703